jgi:hypothetical protein
VLIAVVEEAVVVEVVVTPHAVVKVQEVSTSVATANEVVVVV